MKKQTFLEVMAGSQTTMRMTQSQKRVLRKVFDSKDPELAASQISAARDSRNLIEATKVLAQYGYVTTDPFIMGPDDEPQAVALTPKGAEAVEEYDIATDPTLVTPEEQAASAPEEPLGGGEPSTADMSDPNPLVGGEEQGGEGEEGGGLELSSFFHEINDLAILNSKRN